MTDEIIVRVYVTQTTAELIKDLNIELDISRFPEDVDPEEIKKRFYWAYAEKLLIKHPEIKAVVERIAQELPDGCEYEEYKRWYGARVRDLCQSFLLDRRPSYDSLLPHRMPPPDNAP